MQDKNPSIEEFCAHGQAALRAGDHSRASEYYRSALEIDAENLSANAGLGLALLLSQSFADSIPFLEQAVTGMPTDPMVLEALGVAYVHVGRSSEAELVLRKALRFGRNNPETLANLSAALNENGKFDEAEKMLRNCIRKVPDHLQARHNLSLLRLLKGDFEQGWPGFELRNAAANRALPVCAQNCGAPDWRGENLKGRSIVLYAEQGLGDTIQFARYAKPLATQGATVSIQCQPALMDILRTIDGVSQVLSNDDIAGRVDYKASLLSLPALLNTVEDNIPDSVPYIRAPQDEHDRWSGVLAGVSDKPRVGLVWAGNPDNKTDHKRSIALHQFIPLLERTDIFVMSLQVGAAASQVDELPPANKPYVLFPRIRPLGEVAAALENLDLLITVDTALAHLAGALNVPVWTLITHFPDWRWMLDRDDTPWYPSMRLFRQPTPGNWGAVIEDVSQALERQNFD